MIFIAAHITYGVKVAKSDFGPSVVQGRTLRQRIEAREVEMIDAQVSDGGIAVAQCIRRTDGCLLDTLYRERRLRHPGEDGDDSAKRRLEAGMWLRELYHEKAMLAPRSTAYYGEGRGGEDEIPEHVAWNRKVVTDTMRALYRHANLLMRVCCHDEMPRQDQHMIVVALDALADHRGM